MINLSRYIAIDYIYNIVDLEEIHILDPDAFHLWYDLGFTRDLNMEDKIVLSNAFQKMAKYLLEYKETTKMDQSDITLLWDRKRVSGHSEIFETCIFPIIRRTYTKYHVILKPEDYEKTWYVYYPMIYEHILSKLHTGLVIDIEAEATAIFCQVIGKKYRNNLRVKKSKKHEKHKNE